MSALKHIEKMLVTRPIRPAASCRLFCFPWAGGGTGFFAKWGAQLPATLEVCVVRLPCRELRMSDAPYPDWPTMVDDIIDTLLPKIQEMPFGIYGHSFGALLAFEVARHLKDRHGLRPKHMFLSGTFAPHGDQRRRDRAEFVKMADATDEDFVASLKRNGGTPKELLENEALIKLFLPSMKHDFRLVGQYRFEGRVSVLDCPITFFDGTHDKKHDITFKDHKHGKISLKYDSRQHQPAKLCNNLLHKIFSIHVCAPFHFHFVVWREMTSSDFDIQLLPGGHFFLLDKSNETKITDHIKSKLR
ncbi:S-acyl fatty acid synthase thioesterase, medium chain-like [Acanthaster planci]|uniref:oleoyl-[acyl-carrier-protein] hydrolase n=1 Tax=Acanthaster planci TaxID=133434 RepID=A0A8B7XMU8_ACAPL|nr:S-acyl fatty acid synthase thioesterase, medium chain-like [Acanthaster planci]